MKREYGSVYKRIALVLLGATTVCLFSACASNDEQVNYENIGNIVENTKEDESGNGVQLSEESTEQPQISPDISSEQPQIPTNENSEQQNNISNEQSDNLSAEDKFKTILLGNGKFVSTEGQNRELTLETVGEAVTDDDSVAVKATQFTIIDLDGDRENEVVLWIQINGVVDYGYEILYFQDGEVHGYTLPYRSFMSVKTDGTFTFSDSAADSGIGKLRYSTDGYVIENIIDEAYSEEEINTAMNQQDAKTDVDWYDLSVDSVNIAFESMF